MAIYPAGIQPLRQWIGYRLVRSKDKTDKIPINPHTGHKASSTDPSTWGAYQEALDSILRYGLDGVGFVFTESDPYCGVDLDNCIDDAGNLTELASGIAQRLQSYTAFSQSGNGLHIIVRATLPPGRRQAAFGGLYDAGRFFALTGNLFLGSPTTIEDRQSEIDALHAELFPAAKAHRNQKAAQPVTLDDQELLGKMFDARNGASARRLWEGDIPKGKTHSEADLALCSHLAFWCGGDASRINALFRQSGLMRDKWADREDYRNRTIARALESERFYDPQPGKGKVGKRTKPFLWDMREGAITGPTWNMREVALTGEDIGIWHQ